MKGCKLNEQVRGRQNWSKWTPITDHILPSLIVKPRQRISSQPIEHVEPNVTSSCLVDVVVDGRIPLGQFYVQINAQKSKSPLRAHLISVSYLMYKV